MLRKVRAESVPNMEKIAEIRAKLQDAPEDPELWYALGAEYSQSEFETSWDAYSMAIAYAPFNAEYYFNRGRKGLSTERFAAALADFHMCLRLDPSDGQMWHYLGVALYYLKKYEEAAQYFRDALAMNRKTGSDCIWPEVDWLWMSLMRAGDAKGAAEALSLVEDDYYSNDSDMAYKKRVRLYKGADSIETFMEKVNREDNLDEVTELYGAVNYWLFLGNDKAKASALTDEIVAMPENHNAFGWKCAAFDRRDGIA